MDNEPTTVGRLCARCGHQKHYTGSRWRCSPCYNAWQSERRQRLTPEQRAQVEATRTATRRQWSAERRAAEYDKVREWREQNRDYTRWAERQRYHADSAKQRTRKLDHYRRDPEPFLARNLLRKARRLAAICTHGDGCVSTEFLRSVYADRCAYCGAQAENADHVIPLSRGGLHCRENIAPACEACNKSKHARDVDEWLAERLA